MARLLQRLYRLWHHRWVEAQVRETFPDDVLQRLERAIAASERLHTGQLRLCVEGGLPYSYIWRNASARDRAVGLFGKLRVWDTEHNNGVLIYLLLAEHAIEIVADRAMNRAVPQLTWDAIVRDMQQSFQQAAYAQGLEQALELVSQLLVAHFPRSPADRPDAAGNLPDAPVVQGRFTKDV